MSGEGAAAVEPFDASAYRVAVVAASWHTQVMDGLIDGAQRAARDAGIEPTLVRVPGTFELPVAEADQLELAERFDDGLPQHRLLGEPQGLQGDPRGAYLDHVDNPTGWRLLLQLDSGPPLDVLFGDVGRLYVLIRDADLRAHRWDRVWPALQC